MSKVHFTDDAWEDYLYWQTTNKKTLKRVNQLIKDIGRNGTKGIGKPELLRGDLSGHWSRHIDEANRIVYRLLDNDIIEIHQIGTHYGDK